MLSEDAFLDKLLADPADDCTRLVYADWLDEQGDATSGAEAEFLRLTVEQAATKGTEGRRAERQERLRELAASLDTDWLAVVSRLPIENCPKQRGRGRERAHRRRLFTFVCDRRWEDLKPIADRDVRFCDDCRENVHYCDTITTARKHAWQGHCIAVDLGILRREGDLEPPMRLLGRVSPSAFRREEERVRHDPVSADRERRRIEQKPADET